MEVIIDTILLIIIITELFLLFIITKTYSNLNDKLKEYAKIYEEDRKILNRLRKKNEDNENKIWLLYQNLNKNGTIDTHKLIHMIDNHGYETENVVCFCEYFEGSDRWCKDLVMKWGYYESDN